MIVKVSEEGGILARVSLVLSDGRSAPSFEFAEEHHVPHEGLRGAGKIQKGPKQVIIKPKNIVFSSKSLSLR